MTDTPLKGLRIMIVEDDFYLATDASEAIGEAGGEVVGPFGTAEEALAALDGEDADVAVIDLNLGQGPDFGLARHLASIKLPFLLTSGYDRKVVPDDLSAIVRLEKPFRTDDLISAVVSVHQTANSGGR